MTREITEAMITNVKVLIKSSHKFWLAIMANPTNVNNGKPYFLGVVKIAINVMPAIINGIGTATKALVIPSMTVCPTCCIKLNSPDK